MSSPVASSTPRTNNPPGRVARNVEIKARVQDMAALRARAASLATSPVERIQQTDTFFHASTGRLKVREFPDGSGELIAYERPDHAGPKASVYTRCPCGSAQALVEILRRILPLRGAVTKEREVFLVGRTRIHLDRVVDLGDFMELEVVLKDGEPLEAGEREAHDLLRALNISEGALVSHAYIDLLERR